MGAHETATLAFMMVGIKFMCMLHAWSHVEDGGSTLKSNERNNRTNVILHKSMQGSS